MATGPIKAEQYLAPETLGQLLPFELRAKTIAEGVMSGMHRSPHQGLSVEFAEHRQYVPGEPVRHLDWKVFGRSDKLYLKRYVQETNLDVVLLVDGSGSMRYGTLPIKEGWGGTSASIRTRMWTKFDHATAIAAAFAYLCLKQRDRVGVGIFAADLRAQLRRSNSRDQWRSVVQVLSTDPVEGTANLVKVADQTVAKVTNRSLVVVIGDFLGPVEALRESLARFRYRGHDVILVQTLDRQEMRFRLDEPAPFIGLEGEAMLQVDPASIREAYLAALRAHLDAIDRITRGFGYDSIRVDTHESIGPAISALLARREASVSRHGRSRTG